MKSLIGQIIIGACCMSEVFGTVSAACEHFGISDIMHGGLLVLVSPASYFIMHAFKD